MNYLLGVLPNRDCLSWHVLFHPAQDTRQLGEQPCYGTRAVHFSVPNFDSTSSPASPHSAGVISPVTVR